MSSSSRFAASYQAPRSTARLYTMVAILLAAFALRLVPWGVNRFLEDEALYAVWGLQVATGADPMLDYEPVDKPPLHVYSLAFSFLILGNPLPLTAPPEVVESAARLPSLLASMSGIALIYAVGSRLYGIPNTGIAAAALLALSPFDILFASTAFTDPSMVALSLASILAAASARWGLAGVLLAFTAATKQQGLLFLPLAVALGLVRRRSRAVHSQPSHLHTLPLCRASRTVRIGQRLWAQPSLRFLGGFALVSAAVLWWDASRLQRPGFLEQSLMSYGHLEWSPVAGLAQRGLEWLRWVAHFWSSPWTWALLATILAGWLLGGSRWRSSGSSLRHAFARPCPADRALFLFVAGFLLLHWLVGFQVWDRYLLGLVPLVALLFARAMTGLSTLFSLTRWRRAYSLLTAALLAACLAWPALQAARGELPLGGDHGAYDGIDEVASFVRTQFTSGAVLYHYWLGYHYRFYLYGAPVRLHWYPDLNDLVRDACTYRREPRYIGFPTWQTSAPAQQALAGAGIRLAPALEVARRDGTASFRLFELVGP